MENEVKLFYPPDGKRRHRFCMVERKGVKMWVDLTVLRHCTRYGSVPLCRLVDEKMIFDHFESAGFLHGEGVY